MVRSKKFAGVWLHHLKNGDISYYIQYIDENGTNQKTKVGKKSQKITEQYCFQKRNEIINKIRLGENDPLFKTNKGILFDELFGKYLEDMELRGKSEKSVKFTKRKYENHLKPFIANKRLESLTVEVLNGIKKEKIKTLAPKTVNGILVLVSTVLKYANKTLDMKVTNHVDSGKVPLYKVNNTRERYLNPEEIDLLLEHTKQNIHVDMVTRLSLSTGGRLGTVYAIKKKDINVEKRSVKLTDFKSGGDTYLGYLHPKFFPDFEFLKDLDDEDYVVSDKGKRISYGRIQHLFKKITDPIFNLNIPKDDRKNRLVIHSLRHSFCSAMIKNNVSVVTLQRVVGHKSITSTLKYSHLSQESMFEEVDKVFA